MNIFSQLNKWYQDHAWTRGRYLRWHDGEPVAACLVGGTYLLKVGKGRGIWWKTKGFLRTHRERKVLRQAIREAGWRLGLGHIIPYNDNFCTGPNQIRRVLKRAAEIWDEKYPSAQPALPEDAIEAPVGFAVDLLADEPLGESPTLEGLDVAHQPRSLVEVGA